MIRDDTLVNVVKKFCRSTSIAFLRRIVDHRLKMLNIVMFLAVASYCCYQCACNVQSYLNYSVVTKTLFVNLSSLYFPAISFCPVYSIKKSVFGNLENLDLGLAFAYANTVGEIEKLTLEVCIKFTSVYCTCFATFLFARINLRAIITTTCLMMQSCKIDSTMKTYYKTALCGQQQNIF